LSIELFKVNIRKALASLLPFGRELHLRRLVRGMRKVRGILERSDETDDREDIL